jgi:hypothetical protein
MTARRWVLRAGGVVLLAAATVSLFITAAQAGS